MTIWYRQINAQRTRKWHDLPSRIRKIRFVSFLKTPTKPKNAFKNSPNIIVSMRDSPFFANFWTSCKATRSFHIVRWPTDLRVDRYSDQVRPSLVQLLTATDFFNAKRPPIFLEGLWQLYKFPPTLSQKIFSYRHWLPELELKSKWNCNNPVKNRCHKRNQ